jgi:xylulokinase
MSLLLGIDIGTSSVKALLFDPATNATLAVATREYPVNRPAPDRAEQDADDWWRASIEVVRAVLAQAGRTDVAAIGLCGQMHGVTLVDGAGKVVRPSIIWADQRTTQESQLLAETIGVERYTRIAGTLPAAGFMGPTLLWLLRCEPSSLERAAFVLLPKDYLRLRLTGSIATDVSDAAATGLFDIAAKTWSHEIITAAGLPERLFPPVLNSYAVAGALIPTAAEILGLAPGIPVVAGCADQPAQALANGLIRPGKTSVTVGSGGQVFTPVRPPLATDARLHVFNHAAPETWYILGAILSAGLSLRWLRHLVGLDGQKDAYAILSAEAVNISPGAAGLIFLPYLSGERTPHMDAQARGAFIGLSAFHERGHLARAVMEGVTFALREALEISLSLGGQAEMVIAAGGGAESDVWRQIMADVFGLPLRRSLRAEQTIVGAALLAGIGVGIYDSFEEAVERTVRYGDPTDPNPALSATYAERYAQFQSLYPRLRRDFHQLSQYR